MGIPSETTESVCRHCSKWITLRLHADGPWWEDGDGFVNCAKGRPHAPAAWAERP